MKVSAPQFMSSSAPPAADAPTPIPDGPADPAAPPPEPPKPAVWPEWFTGVDNALLVMALLFAFFMASFAARNPDIFRHLAGGQRLLNGTYALGSDPFSFTGADRPWVNQSWLFDLTVYAVYSADPTGAVAVVLKAVVFAAAFGVLLLFRRPGQAGWPWAVCIVAGALAASGTAQLRPIVFGMLFCSLLLLLLFRGDWTARRGRTLALVGGLCWLWGGFDSFALIGPLLLLVAAIAGAVQSAFDSPFLTEDGQPATPPVAPGLFDSPPAPKTLFLAAAVGLLGVLLNPTFVIGLTKSPVAAVAQLLPYELAFGTTDAMAEDEELRSLTYSVLSSEYWRSEGLGKNAGSVGLFLLVVVGALGLAVGVTKPPVGLIGLWFATLLLGFAHYRFVPLFAVAAVPLVAGLLNAVTFRFPLGTTADARTKGLLTASRAGRIVTVPLFLALLAATVPGWLQPQYTDPSLARRLEWRIAADEAFVRGVEQVQRWRASGDLPADARGLIVHPEFGDYAAWFAPAEPVFANGRYRFHAAEVDDLILVREALLTRRSRRAADAPPPAPEPATPVADKYGAGYCVLGRPHTQIDTQAVFAAILDVGAPQSNLTALWHLDGRTAVVGRSNTQRALALGERLALDPVRLAFAPQSPLPEGPVRSPADQDAGWLGAFLDRPPTTAAYTDDVVAFSNLAGWAAVQEDLRTGPERITDLAAAIGGWPIDTPRPIPARARVSVAELAIPLIVCRAARLAVHQTPDEERAYFVLARAYQFGRLPEFEAGDLTRQRLTALARFTARLPAAERCPTYLLPRALEGWLDLFLLQCELSQFDLARESVKKAHELVRAAATITPDSGGLVRRVAAVAAARYAPLYKRTTGEDLMSGRDEFQFEEQAKKSGRNEPLSATDLLKKMEDGVTRVVSRGTEEWDKRTRGAKPGQRALGALQFGLPGKALELIEPMLQKDAADPGVPGLDLGMNFVAQLLEVGRLEVADAYITELEKTAAQFPPAARDQLLAMKLTKLRRQGSCRQAIAVLDEFRGGTRLPKLTAAERVNAGLRPSELASQVSAVAGPLGGMVPQFNPPAGVRQEEGMALFADFKKRYLDTHPFVIGHAPREKVLAEAQFFYQRGILALYDGDVATARASFEEVFRPQGLSFDDILICHTESSFFLRQQFDVLQFMPSAQFLRPYALMIDRHKDAPPPAGGPK